MIELILPRLQFDLSATALGQVVESSLNGCRVDSFVVAWQGKPAFCTLLPSSSSGNSTKHKCKQGP